MWTPPSTVAVGQVATAAFWNAQVRDNLLYLHGDAGAIEINAGLGIGRPLDAGSVLSVNGAINGTAGLTIAGNLLVESGGFRVHRHPYGNERHIESGAVSIASGGSSASLSFINAYAVAPTVVWNFSNSDIVDFERDASTVSISTTGATITFNSETAARIIYWIAVGAD